MMNKRHGWTIGGSSHPMVKFGDGIGRETMAEIYIALDTSSSDGGDQIIMFAA